MIGKSFSKRNDLPVWYRIFSAAMSAIAVVVVFFSLSIVVITNASKAGNSIFGYTFLQVLSDSMSPEFERGDVIVAQSYNGETLSVGDVVVFVAPSGANQGKTVTHRIVEVMNDGENVKYRTKGDAAQFADSWELSAQDIKAVYIKVMPFITQASEFAGSSAGKGVMIALPLVFLVAVFAVDSFAASKLRESAKKAENNPTNSENGEHSSDNR
ncbi:MAG: signal peptidase I [Acutalibacteraceae bacterium]